MPEPTIENIGSADKSGGVTEEANNGPKPQRRAVPREDVRESARGNGIEEMTERDRARLALAYWILGVTAALMLGAGCSYLHASPTNLDQAKALWEFAKTFCPPLITLVIGFYFTRE